MNTITIQEALELDEGSSVSGIKGRVKNVYDPAKTAKGLKHQTIILEDSSESTKVKLWAHSVIGKLEAGQNIVILSGGDNSIRVVEYNGNMEIAVNKSAKISSKSSLGSSDESPKASKSGGGGGVSGQGLDVDQLTEVYAMTASLMREKAIKAGLSEKVADMMSVNINSWVPLWWFGEKSVKMPAPPLGAQLAEKAGVDISIANNFIRMYMEGEYGEESTNPSSDDIQQILSKASINALRMQAKQLNKNTEEESGFEDEDEEGSPF